MKCNFSVQSVPKPGDGQSEGPGGGDEVHAQGQLRPST